MYVHLYSTLYETSAAQTWVQLKTNKLKTNYLFTISKYLYA